MSLYQINCDFSRSHGGDRLPRHKLGKPICLGCWAEPAENPELPRLEAHQVGNALAYQPEINQTKE